MGLGVTGILTAFERFIARSPRNPIGRFFNQRMPPLTIVFVYAGVLLLIGQIAIADWSQAGKVGYLVGFLVGGAALARELGMWGPGAR